MAKKKGAKKASRGAIRQTAANVAPAEAARAAAGDEAELRSGAEVTRLLTEILKSLEVERQGEADARNVAQRTLQRIEDRLRSLEESIHPTRAETPATEEKPTVLEIQLAVIRGWQEQIWIDECESTQPCRLPRATLIGRAIRELKPKDTKHLREIIEIFEAVEKKGAHHLSDRIRQDIATYRNKDAHDTKSRNKASAGLTGLFKPRYSWLSRMKLAESGEKRCLSERGLEVFDEWPDWNVQDDAPWECFGRANPPQDEAV